MKKIIIAQCFAVLFVGCFSSLHATNVRNGDLTLFGWTGPAGGVEQLRNNGWKCPEAKDWPSWWGGYGSNVQLEIFKGGGQSGGPYGRITGSDGFLWVYHGLDLEKDQILTVWAKGHGSLQMGFLSYEKGSDGVFHQLTGPQAAEPLTVTVNSDSWVCYRHVMKKTPGLNQVHVTIAAPKGTIDFDNVDLDPATPARELMVAQAEQLYGTGALIENLQWIQADATFQTKRDDYTAALKAFRTQEGSLKADLVTSVEKEVGELDPYINVGDNQTVPATRFNDMILLTRVMQALGQEPVKAPETLQMQKPESMEAVQNYKPGVRLPRDGTVTVIDVRSNKVRYDENEKAKTAATLVNQSTALHHGTVIALMHLDMDTIREIARADFTLQPNETKEWDFSYSVGPETYGRGIEVRFEENGALVDSWQEFYAVAAEWFRVQQSTTNAANNLYSVDSHVTYANQFHEFQCEPTDFGVYYPKGVDQYRSGQASYLLDYAKRRALHALWESEGIRHTIYQTICLDAQMGYEVFRRHPELAMYDANGQPAVDPVYGGVPNPMMDESPIEVGPKRKVAKPYLNRLLDTSFGHVNVNLAPLENMEYEINSILAYRKELPFDGVYVDGNWGVLEGFDYDGRATVPSGDDKDYARLGARNHHLWSEALKKDNPNFGTWYNWGERGAEYLQETGIKTALGRGLKGDVGDENIRAAVDWKNVMILSEIQDTFTAKEGIYTEPKSHLDWLIKERDYVIQPYGANEVIGYINTPLTAENPGPSKWGWPTVNYFGAQVIATQMHFISWFFPSYRPTLQFMTRYSALIWARDLKAVADAKKIVAVTSPEKIGWEKLIYRRTTANGYDLIIHLVRFPSTEHWDINFPNEPQPLEGVTVDVKVPQGKIIEARALRPYYFEEPQQPVEQKLLPLAENGSVSMHVPPFRYYQMIFLHVASRNLTKSENT